MFKIIEQIKRKDEIEFRRFSKEVNFKMIDFSDENDRRLENLNRKRKFKNKNKQKSSLWANAIKNGKF